MSRRQNCIVVVLIILMACGIMAFVEAVMVPGYALKSVIKIFLFIAVPVLVISRHKEVDLRGILRIEGKKLIAPILLGIVVYLIIIVAYYTIGRLFDFSQVAEAITGSSGVDKKEFVWVALYISFINSLVEEFFFRGIGFLLLRQLTTRRVAYVFSAAAFSLYHVAIISSWFSFYLFLLLMISLFVAGLLFNLLNEKSGTIYHSWLVHMCANFAINTIGFILFGIL
ncbi:MAG: Abortive infection protein [Herbinix sp.]|nr:Abortive infection protein [Herbinix sp.]